MKKLLMLAAVISLGCFWAGCTSVPNYCNLSGSWNYTFEETGRDGIQTGSMTLVQDGFQLSGKANDSFGEFTVTGNITVGGTKLVINGKRNDGRRNFQLSAALRGENTFEGTYTTDQNTSGTLKACRIVGR